MFRATCSLLLLLAGQVFADGWSSDVWPSQEYPMEGWRQLHECYTATVERCNALNIVAPQYPTNHLTLYNSVTNIKQRLRSSIPSFVNTNLTDTISPYLEAWFALNTGSAPDLPLWTVTGLLSHCQMPTNYFEFTPRLGMSGLGPFTNDTSTTYPHGYTTTYTTKGGNNFPGTRNAWYDTDYGFAGMTNIFAECLWSLQESQPQATGVWEGVSFSSGVSWTNSFVAAEANYNNTTLRAWSYTTGGQPGRPSYDLGYQYGSRIRYYTPDGFCDVLKRWDVKINGLQFWGVTPMTTTLVHDVEFYLYTTNMSAAKVCASGYTHYYDTYATPVGTLVNGRFAYLDLVIASTATNTTSASFGTTNLPVRPSQPPTDVANGFSTVGDGMQCLSRWDVSGGFQFK